MIVGILGRGFIARSLYKLLKESDVSVKNYLSTNDLEDKDDISILIDCCTSTRAIFLQENEEIKYFSHELKKLSDIYNFISNRKNIKLIRLDSISSYIKNNYKQSINPYFAIKRLSNNLDQMIEKLNLISITHIVIPNAYGPGCSLENDRLRFIPATIIKAKEARLNNLENYKINCSSKIERDFIYIEDLCEIIKVIMLNELSDKSQIISITSGKHIKLKEITNVIDKYFNVRAIFDDTEIVKEIDSKNIECEKVMSPLSIKSLSKGIIETINYIENRLESNK